MIEKSKLYDTHIPISGIERTVLTVGSAIAALKNPLRGGNGCINMCTENTNMYTIWWLLWEKQQAIYF